MKRDARIGLAVVLVLGLSITLLVARSIHRHGAEAGIGDPPATGAEPAAVVKAQPIEVAATTDPAYDAHARAILEFQAQHDYTPGPVSEVSDPSTASEGATPAPDFESPRTLTGTASAESSFAREQGLLPNLGEPPVPVTTMPAPNAAGSANLLGSYTIAAGDNPWKISARVFGNGKYAQQIVDANPGLNPARLRVGQKIHIPAVDGVTPVVQLENAAMAAAVPLTAGSGRAPAPGPVVASGVAVDPAAGEGNSSAVRTHTIQSGETLGAIAAKYLGSSGPKTVKKLIDANPGVDPRRLKIGYELKIPAP